MTEEKIQIKYGTGKDENGNQINFVEFPCPKCQSSTISLTAKTKEKEFMTFTCDICGGLQYFEKPAIPEAPSA
jgi:transcription elongation factor Elf1